MTFKVGDKVVDVKSGYQKDDGSKVTTGTVDRVMADGDVNVSFDDTVGSWLCRKWEVKLVEPAPIGKTLTELDVKPGDVVRGVGCTFADEKDFTCVEIVPDNPYKGEHTLKSESYGQGIFGNEDGKWIVVSRAPQPTSEPKRMHPDDVATACEQYLRDCGYTMARLDLVTALGAEYSIEPTQRF